MRAFDTVHVIASVLAAFIPLLLAVNDLGLALVCTVGVAAGAAIAGIGCRWWPGLSAPGWRLWLAAWLFNPVVVLGLGYVLSQYECLLGQVRGWGCMGLALVVLASPTTLIGPTAAVIAHVIARRRQAQQGRRAVPS